MYIKSLSSRSLRGLDLNQRPLCYESGGLVPCVPSGAVSCRPVQAPCRRAPSYAAELRVVRLQMVCIKASKDPPKSPLSTQLHRSSEETLRPHEIT